MDKTFIQNETTIVTEVLEGSPAKIVGIEPGMLFQILLSMVKLRAFNK